MSGATVERSTLTLGGIEIPVLRRGRYVEIDSTVEALQPMSWVVNAIRAGRGRATDRKKRRLEARVALERGESLGDQALSLSHVRTFGPEDVDYLAPARELWRALAGRDAGDDAYVTGLKHERRRMIAPRAFLLALFERLDALERPPDDILRFPSATKHDPEIDEWLRAQRDELRPFVEAWFARMRRCGDDVRELMHDGCPTACVGDASFAYVAAYATHVNVGFFFGALLEDPARLLEGTGKRGRHVKLRPGREIDERALDQLIDAAYADVRARLRE